MRLRRPKGQHKKECAKCGKDKEPELVGINAYCRKCSAAYFRQYRAKKSELISAALQFYNQHAGQL